MIENSSAVLAKMHAEHEMINVSSKHVGRDNAHSLDWKVLKKKKT